MLNVVEPTVKELLKEQLLPVELFGGQKYTVDEKDNHKIETYEPPLYIVDRFHVDGHTEVACLGPPKQSKAGKYHYAHPSFKQVMEGVNTSVCEQTFSWMGGYKFTVRNFNRYQYWFFIYILVYMKNQSIEQIINDKKQQIERKRRHDEYVQQ